MKTDLKALYVHIPFCKKKCNYCDFCSFDNLSESERKSYLSALIAEIRGYKKEEPIPLETVFFGGGTPSLLTGEEFFGIYSAISESFDLSHLSEFTIEANPKTLTKENLEKYLECGVNRISFGLQTIHEKEYKKLGRIHNLSDFESSLKLAREAGIVNINVDLMFGIPHQTKKSFKETLDYVISKNVPHLSVYGLIVEENTPFGKEGNALVLPTEDEEYEMYFLAAEALKKAGYSHYEISNFAFEGFESHHNLYYWRAKEYIGVGIAAHSYYDEKRVANTESFSEYISENREKYRKTELIGKDEEEYEYAMLALRLKDGILLSEYKKLFGKDFIEGRKTQIEKFLNLGLISITEESVFLTEKGFYLSNTILTDIL